MFMDFIDPRFCISVKILRNYWTFVLITLICVCSKRTPVTLPKLAPFKDILTEKTPHNLRSPTNGCQLRDILSENEKRFCKRIGMKTASYVTIKTSILKVSNQ